MSNKAFDDMSLAEQKAHLLRRSKEIDQQAAELASKARGQSNKARPKRREVPDVSEKALLALGGKKAGNDIIFGPEGETQLIFTLSKGRMKGLARWTVSMPPVPVSGYDTQRELSKANRGLLDKEKGEPSVAFKAAEQLLACHVEKLQALHVEVTPLHELSERPETEALMEQLIKMSERLDTVSHQLIEAQAAIHLVVEVLSEEHGEIKLKKAFDLVQGDQWSRDIQKLRDCTMFLAATLQRPPSKKELRERYDPADKESAQFSRLLKPAGLSWLPSMAQLRRALSPRNLR